MEDKKIQDTKIGVVFFYIFFVMYVVHVFADYRTVIYNRIYSVIKLEFVKNG